nr:MAG TPA: hypothetical protein [Bacteriophage sp.]
MTPIRSATSFCVRPLCLRRSTRVRKKLSRSSCS